METRPVLFKEDLNRFRSGPSRLEGRIASCPSQAMDIKLPDRWTIRQTVHHLADGDYLWKLFILMALAGGEEPFQIHWYWTAGQPEMASRWQYARREVASSLALFAANRKHTCEILQAIPDAGRLILPVRWPDGSQQPVSIAEVVASQADHVDGHLEDIEAVLASFME
jgi:hypothetical protein